MTQSPGEADRDDAMAMATVTPPRHHNCRSYDLLDRTPGYYRRSTILGCLARRMLGRIQRDGYGTVMWEINQTPDVCVDDLEQLKCYLTARYHPETGTHRHWTRVYGRVTRAIDL